MLKGAYVFAVTMQVAVAASAFADDAGFTAHCSGCHGTAAEGIPGLAPPLKHPELWRALGDRAPTYIAGVLANGLSGSLRAYGQTYSAVVMPPQTALAPAEAAAIASYILGLNGLQTKVTEEQISEARDQAVGHANVKALRPKDVL